MKKTVPMLLFLATTVVSAFAADGARSSSELERKADALYSSKDAVLYNLDSEMLHYYKGDYNTAIERLSTAEVLIDECFTKSMAQNTAAFLTNDSAPDYAGENYEDIYLNLFNVFDRIYFDIGTEPESSASSTYGLFQYNWTRTFASNIKLKYTSATEIEDEIAGYGNAVGIDKHKEFELDLLPAIWTIPIGNKNRFSLSVGGSYQYIKENYFAGMFDVNGLMLDEGDEGKYFTVKNDKTAHIFAPRLGLDWRMPLHKNVSLNFDVYVNPIYALSLSQSMGYHSDQTELPFDYGGDNTVFRWSAPYVDAKVYADFFQFVRLVSQLSYQRLDFQQMDWASDYESLVGYDDIQSITKLRFGVELLVGKRHTARARGGVYYQNEWNASSYTGETTYKGKWVISIGTER